MEVFFGIVAAIATVGTTGWFVVISEKPGMWWAGLNLPALYVLSTPFWLASYEATQNYQTETDPATELFMNTWFFGSSGLTVLISCIWLVNLLKSKIEVKTDSPISTPKNHARETPVALPATKSPVDSSIKHKKERTFEFERWQHLDGSSLVHRSNKFKEGSFGAVIPVKQLNYGPKRNITRYGAIKILKGTKVTEVEYAAFREEANKLADIHHPNVATLLDWPKKKREKWFVMEMVGSRNLGDLCGNVSGQELLGYAKDIFSGLVEVHSKKMVHFDLKPHNIGVRDDGNSCALLDFGLSFTPRKEQPKYLTTPEYAAPELFGNFNLNQASATDVYSAAITIMHLDSGNLPWKNSRSNMNALVTEVTTVGPRWTGINNPGLRNFLKPLIHFDPLKRPTAGEVLRHLQSKGFNSWPKGSKYAQIAAELDAIREAKFGN